MSRTRITAALVLGISLWALAPTAFAQDRVTSCPMPVAQPLAPVSGRAVFEQDNLTLPASGVATPVAFELEEGRSYVVETFALSGATDTVLAIHRGPSASASAANAVLAENDDAQPGTLSSRASITATSSGRYYAHVRPYDSTSAGSFGIRVTEVAAVAALTGPKLR